MTYTVVLVRDDEVGGYCVHVPALKGCHTEGDDLPEALRMAAEAIECHLESLHARGQELPADVTVCSVDVSDLREACIYKVTVQGPTSEPQEVAVA